MNVQRTFFSFIFLNLKSLYLLCRTYPWKRPGDGFQFFLWVEHSLPEEPAPPCHPPYLSSANTDCAIFQVIKIDGFLLFLLRYSVFRNVMMGSFWVQHTLKRTKWMGKFRLHLCLQTCDSISRLTAVWELWPFWPQNILYSPTNFNYNRTESYRTNLLDK